MCCPRSTRRESHGNFLIGQGRPIVLYCGSESYGVAELISFYLNPISIRHVSHLKDTYHSRRYVKSGLVREPDFFLRT